METSYRAAPCLFPRLIRRRIRDESFSHALQEWLVRWVLFPDGNRGGSSTGPQSPPYTSTQRHQTVRAPTAANHVF
jgi:hypothetical protein